MQPKNLIVVKTIVKYYKLSIMLFTNVIIQSNETDERNGIPVSYSDKDSFGDIDFLSTITSEEFEKRIKNDLYSDKLEIVGKVKTFSKI